MTPLVVVLAENPFDSLNFNVRVSEGFSALGVECSAFRKTSGVVRREGRLAWVLVFGSAGHPDLA